MKKSYLVILLAIALGAGTVLGAYITRYVWQTNMTMRLTGIHTYDVELKYPNGTQITNYNWGDFAYWETKTLDCNLEFLGNGTYSVYWNTTDLPDGWYIQIWDGYEFNYWLENGMTLAHSSGDPPLPLTIYLTAPTGYGELDQPLGFTLNFVAAEYVP
jgi:hypothetical protein